MFGWLRKLSSSAPEPQLPAPLDSFDTTTLRPTLIVRSGLPQIDWDLANLWISRHHPDASDSAQVRRAVVAAWLDELKASLRQPHVCGRQPAFESITPASGSVGTRALTAASRSLTMLQSSLAPIRGDAPIPPFALVALATNADYLSFISHFYPDDGHWATTGGLYLAGDEDHFPILAINTVPGHGVENTVAHELTHHALRDRNLPPWLEEGYTQMMEERLTGHNNFELTHELADQQRDRWQGYALSAFLDGSAFHSPEDEDQKLAYHLSQWIIRRALDESPKKFFAFTRDCLLHDPEEACLKNLGQTPQELIHHLTGISPE